MEELPDPGLAAGPGADPDAVHTSTCLLEPPRSDALLLPAVLYGAGIAAVEWCERLLPAAGDEFVLVSLRAGAGDSRSIRLEAHGPRHRGWLRAALGT